MPLHCTGVRVVSIPRPGTSRASTTTGAQLPQPAGIRGAEWQNCLTACPQNRGRVSSIPPPETVSPSGAGRRAIGGGGLAVLQRQFYHREANASPRRAQLRTAGPLTHARRPPARWRHPLFEGPAVPADDVRRAGLFSPIKTCLASRSRRTASPVGVGERAFVAAPRFPYRVRVHRGVHQPRVPRATRLDCSEGSPYTSRRIATTVISSNCGSLPA